jgi:hypothetical protein
MQSAHADLILRGRVTEIVRIPNSHRTAGWRVKVAVEQVLSGDFSEEFFSFAIHSPVKSGLAVGGVYTIRATRVADGYTVNATQWLP